MPLKTVVDDFKRKGKTVSTMGNGISGLNPHYELPILAKQQGGFHQDIMLPEKGRTPAAN